MLPFENNLKMPAHVFEKVSVHVSAGISDDCCIGVPSRVSSANFCVDVS